MKPAVKYICCFALAFGLLFSAGLSAAKEARVAVLLSREIAPYVAMVEGLERQLGNLPVQRFFLDSQNTPYSLNGFSQALDPAQFEALVAVGPAALRYLEPRSGQVPLLFGMVLNPDKVSGDGDRPLCGVSLNIPIAAQLQAILKHFPWMTRLGVLFDPANNQEWFERAVTEARPLGLELIPLQVERTAGRLSIVGDLATPDAILFIPDQTIIARSVIQYVIKQAVLQKTPVVGYNQFFYDSGATLTFAIDYEKVGQQVAGQVEGLFHGEGCSTLLAPAFETRVNADVWQALQLDRKRGAL